MHVKPEMKVADVGCGTGFFTIPMAKMVGNKGKVFAIDVQEEMIAILNEKIQKLNIRNVETFVSTEENIPLPNESVDLAFMASVLHELDDHSTVKEVHRFLKPQGVLAVLEWKREETPFGPPIWEHLTPNQTREIIEKVGFEVKNTSPVGPYHYLAISVKHA
jgi:ubiquinone/menaquinone biosynthesis C-methylase UbiE